MHRASAAALAISLPDSFAGEEATSVTKKETTSGHHAVEIMSTLRSADMGVGSKRINMQTCGQDADAHGSNKIILELRALLEEQNERLAKVIEGAIAEGQQQMLHSLKSEVTMVQKGQSFSRLGASPTSNGEASDNAPPEYLSTATPVSSSAPRSFDRRETPTSKAIEQAVLNFNMKEEEDDSMFAKANTISDEAIAILNRRNSGYSDTTKYVWRAKLRALLLSFYYEVFISMTIVVNSIYIGFELQYMVGQRLRETPEPLAIINHAFTILFTLELAFRIVAEGKYFLVEHTRWMWNWIDSFLVIFSLLESGADVYHSTYNKRVGGVEQFGSMRVIRMIRITRLLRIFRVARIVRFVKALRTLIYSILCTLKSLAWALLLLLIMNYVFALVFTQAATDHLMEVEYWTNSSANRCASSDPLANNYLCVLDLYWGSLWLSMFTLFKSITNGLGWDVLVQPFRHISPLWEFIFLGYISFSFLAVLNVVTGVFCQSAIEGASLEHDIQVQTQISNKKMYVDRVQALFHTIDSDRSGVITLSELTEHIADEEVQAFFETMELSPTDVWTLFKLMDNDGTHAIDVGEFVDGFLRLRGTATSLDMAKLMCETKWILKSIKNLATYTHLSMSRLRRHDTEMSL